MAADRFDISNDDIWIATGTQTDNRYLNYIAEG